MLSIFSSTNKNDSGKPSISPAAARPAAPAISAQPDIKTEYLGKNELTASRLKELADVAEGCALIMGFVSPDLHVPEIAQRIKQEIPSTTKLILITTAGELCRSQGSHTLYCDSSEGRAKILLQAFSNRMIEATQIISIPLPDSDLRSGSVHMTVSRQFSAKLKNIQRHSA